MAREKYDLEKSDIRLGKLRLPDQYVIPEHEHGEADSFTSIRTATHNGKEVRVETTYRITIGGRPVTARTSVADDGTVHTHGLPNYTFQSALNLAKQLAEYADMELPPDELGTKC